MLGAISSISDSLSRASNASGVHGAERSVSATSMPLGVQQSGSTSFSDMLGQVISSGVETIKAGEAASIGGLQGKVSPQGVVEAVMSAEQNIQIAVAIRDKIVGMYQEVGRMTI